MVVDPETRDRVLVALGVIETRHPAEPPHEQWMHGRRGPNTAKAIAAAKKAAKAATEFEKKAPKVRAPKGASVPAAAKPYHRSITDVADLARAVEKGRLVDERELAGGKTGDVRLRTYEDGVQVVYKRPSKAGSSEDRSMNDAEQLASMVARQLGLRAPRVYRNSDDGVHMEFAADAAVAADHLSSVQNRAYASHEGYMLGLLDVLTDQQDRHEGNWMITESGGLVPIDNAGWWPDYDEPFDGPRDAPYLGSSFGDLFTSHTGGFTAEWIPNDLSKSDIAAIRSRLVDLRPDFEHLGRLEWFDYMMERLDEVERHATGTTSRLLPAR